MGERAVRDGNAKECFTTYRDMARMFEGYNDYETASYFHNRCLDTSIEFNYIEGEARAHQGLGKAEENVFNKFEAKNHLETALEKAKEGGLMHGVQSSDFFLWQGRKALCREAAQWTGQVHAWAGDGEVGRDHDDVCEAWAALGEDEEAPPAPAQPPHRPRS